MKKSKAKAKTRQLQLFIETFDKCYDEETFNDINSQ